MPDALQGLNINPQTLLPTILEHLPNVRSSPQLAGPIFGVIFKANRTRDPERFALPLLPWLTFLALTVPDNLVLPTSHLVVTLVCNLSTQRRTHAFTNTYLSELVALTCQLLETRSPGPVPFCLPSFPLTNNRNVNSTPTSNKNDSTTNTNSTADHDNANQSTGNVLESNDPSHSNNHSNTPSSTQTNSSTSPPCEALPLTPTTLEAALLLLALHIPSNHRPPPPYDKTVTSLSASDPSHDFTPALNASIRLWRGLCPRSRAALLNLASRHELVASRCGPAVSSMAAHALLRALDPVNTVPVPHPLRIRISNVAADAVPYTSNPTLLLRVIAASRTRATLPSSVALPLALQNHGSVGQSVRAVSRAAKLDLFSRIRAASSYSSAHRPVKRQRTNSSPDYSSPGQENIQQQPQQQRQQQRNSVLKNQVESNLRERSSNTSRTENTDENNPNLQNNSVSIDHNRQFSQLRSPASILQRYVTESQAAEGAEQTLNSVRLLTNAVSISADALCALMNAHAVAVPTDSIRRGHIEWPGVAASLSSVVLGCVQRFCTAPIMKLWVSMLSLGEAALRLCIALRAIGDNAGGQIIKASEALRDSLTAIVPLAFKTLQNSSEGFPIDSFSSLLYALGEAGIESPGFLGHNPDFFDVILDIVEFIMVLPKSVPSEQHPVLLRGAFHAKLACVFDGREGEEQHLLVIPEVPKDLPPFVASNLEHFPALSAAVLDALADELCSTLGCCQSHVPRLNWDCVEPKSSRVLSNAAEWTSAIDALVQSSLCKNVDPNVSSAAVRCMAAMAVHCPADRRTDYAKVLVDLLWKVRDQQILNMVLSSLSYLLECEKKGSSRVPQPPTEPIDVDLMDKEDEADTSAIANLILSRLRSCVEKVSENLAARIVPDGANLHAIAYHLLLRFDESLTLQVSELVCPALLQLCAAELLPSSSHSAPARQAITDNQPSTASNMTFWSDLFATAMALNERVDPSRTVRGNLALSNAAEIMAAERGLFNMSLSSSQAFGSMFFSRISDWGHLVLERILRDNSFAAIVSTINLETTGHGFWNKFPRYVVTPLLLREDVNLLNSLASKLETPTRQLVDKTVADSIAVLSMKHIGQDIDYSVISKILETNPYEIMRNKAGKIVQRFVMEFGGPREAQSKAALADFARRYTVDTSGGTQSDEGRSGKLVANHFLLVMDAVNRHLFQSKATENEQMRHLRMLKSILLLVRHHIHAFVPKILATLKLALDSFSGNPRVYAETVQVWSCFLETLGSERILVHVTSILTIILPFLNQLDGTLCKTLASLIQKSAMHSYSERSLVVLLLRISNQELLAKTADMLEQSSPNGECTAVQQGRRDNSALVMSVPAMEKVCQDVGKIISQHGNGVIEVMAARYLLQVLRTNRDRVDEAARSQFSDGEISSSGISLILAKLQTLLVEMLSTTRSPDCLRVIMQCIGEVGAIDPMIVLQAACDPSRSKDRRKTSMAQHEFPRSIHALAALLLDDFLVPTLLAQGEIRSASTSRINRIGLVIQELIRVCGCKKNTDKRASKHAVQRKREDGPVQWDSVLVGETNEENAIFFWENLLPSTRDVIAPYLEEPFDVQHYKAVFGANSAGNEELACQPVWSKIKAAVSTGVVANAQEWRRQIAVQLVDFIGKRGSFGEVLQSLRPILRYEDPITAFVFPLIFVNALDSQPEKKPTSIKNFLIGEVAEVLKEAGAPKIMFDLFDTLRIWREERSLRRANQYANKFCQGNSNSNVSRRKQSIPKLVEIAKKDDSLSCFVDLYEHVSPSLSLLSQARCAFRTRSYARAILLAENHLRLNRKSDQLRTWPATIETILGRISSDPTDNSDDAEAVSILQKCFAELEDADSMRGLAALRSSSSLGEQVLDTEVSGRFNEALINYERAIAQSPRSVQFHRGFLRCLMTLGHWETMLSHAEGLVHSADLNEMELRRMAEANGVEAAWRLGRWENIQSFDSVPLDDIVHESEDAERSGSWDNEFATSFGNVLLALHDRDAEALKIAADGARENLLSPMIRAALEGYNRTYPMIVRLHAVADVESTMEQLIATESNDEGRQPGNSHLSLPQLPNLISMTGRTMMTAPSLKVREPLLSTKRVCFEQMKLFDESAKVSLKLAKIAKEGENLRSAAATAFRGLCMNIKDEDVKHALVMETAQIQRLQGDSSGALLVVKEEINRMRKLIDRNPNPSDKSRIKQTRDRLTSALVVAGSWIANSRSEPSEVVLDYFQQAKMFGPYREEPFYALGKHYDLLIQASLNADEDLTVNAESSQGRSASRRSATPVETHAPEHSSKYVPLVIKSYARTLCNGHSKLSEVLPRMLTVWFDYYTGLDDRNDGYKGMAIEGQVQDVVKIAFKGIPVYMWMTAIPQLMSRILHNRKFVRDELALILARVICFFPDQTYWTIVPATQLKHSAQRKKTITDILNQAIIMMKKDRAGEFSSEIKNRFRERIYNWLVLMTCFVEICEAPGSKERRGRMDNCAKEFKEVKSHLRVGFVNPMIPTLKTLTVRLPTARQADEFQPFDRDTVRIQGIDDNVLVMSSLMCPRRISLIGSDGRQYRYLAKMEDKGDMRRDSRVVEFLTVMNQLLSKEEASTSGECLQLKTYSVLPLTEETGMIEWVNDLCPFRSLVAQEHGRLEKVPGQTMIKQRYDSMSDKRDFLAWAWTQFPPLLDRYFVGKFGGGGGDAATWLAARDQWTRSAAVWSMAGHIVGLGDRHGENVLIETTSGRCVHVDFAMLFEKGRKLRVPEVVPFRLTQNMVTVMGVAGYEGMFRAVCERMMRIVRANGDALLSRIESFLYDPLADWARTETHGAKAGVVATRDAWLARATVKAKLTGMVDKSGLALSIEGQVQRLIREATSIDNLSKMYIWWGAWI